MKNNEEYAEIVTQDSYTTKKSNDEDKKAEFKTGINDDGSDDEQTTRKSNSGSFVEKAMGNIASETKKVALK
jgi:hypothetical protein